MSYELESVDALPPSIFHRAKKLTRQALPIPLEVSLRGMFGTSGCIYQSLSGSQQPRLNHVPLRKKSWCNYEARETSSLTVHHWLAIVGVSPYLAFKFIKTDHEGYYFYGYCTRWIEFARCALLVKFLHRFEFMMSWCELEPSRLMR